MSSPLQPPLTPPPPTPLPESGPRRGRQILFVLAGVLVFLADQVTKGMIDRLPDTADIVVIPHLFRIIHVENPGVAFGLFQYAAPIWRAAIIVGSTLALAAVLVLLWRSKPSLRGGLAMSLIVGGACGNLFDRILHGKVVDFLLFYHGQHSWPAFNLADSAIVVGAFMLVWEILGDRTVEIAPKSQLEQN